MDIWSNKHEKGYNSCAHIIPISRMVDFCESYSPFHVCLTICPSAHLVYATSLLSHFIHIWNAHIMANQDTKYELNQTKDKWLVTYTRFRDGRTDGRTRVFQYTHHSASGGIKIMHSLNLAPVASHWQTLSHNVVHLVLIKIQTRISCDRHWLHR
jgi:hypothetical protein